MGPRFTAALALLSTAVAQDCMYTNEAMKASFDLSAMKMGSSSPYQVKDTFDTIERNYTYVFNVCADADVPDANCEESEAGAGAAPAFQLYDDGRCWRLGNSYKNNEYSLLDAADPTQGFQVTYLDGDTCHLNTDVQREMTVKFKCSESWGKVPDARVVEEMCHYELMFETIFGCPLECPFVNRKLCGGTGFCGMDLDAGKPRCFCNEGHSGADCTTAAEVKGTCDGTCAALIFVVILLTGLLAAGLVIFYRVHKLLEMNVKFGEMATSFGIKTEEETMSLNR